MRWQFRFEPALWMAVARAVVIAGGAWGFTLTQEQTLALYGVIETLTTAITRSFVQPSEPRA